MKKRIVGLSAVVLVVLATLVVSAPGLSQSPTPPALEQLRQDAGGEVEITWNSRTDTPSFIRGNIPLSGVSVQSEGDVSAASLAFVERYAGLFGLRDASHELAVVQTDVDALGMRHVTFNQVYQGVEVYGAHMKVHLSADGQEIVAVSSGFVPGIVLSETQPRVTAEEALASARQALPNGTLVADPKLVIYPGKESPGPSAQLAWLVELRDGAVPARNVYVVDALEGTIVEVIPRLYEEMGSSSKRPLAAESGGSTDQIIIKFRPDVDLTGLTKAQRTAQVAALSELAGIGLSYYRPMSGKSYVLRLPELLPSSKVWEIAAKLNTDPSVLYAEPDLILQPARTPNDSLYENQWHYHEVSSDNLGVNLPGAWDITTGSNAIVMAVIDTGVLLDHPDLLGRTLPGCDFISDTFRANDGDGRDNNPSDPGDWTEADQCFPGSQPRDSSWHGTHVAGTMGAASNNSTGVTGVNWVSKILPVRALGRCGGYSSDIIDGMRWAAGIHVESVSDNQNPAKVLNLSLRAPGSCDSSWQSAIDDVTALGAVVVVAAGNDNQSVSGYVPGNCNGVITVAATNRDGDRTYYSNFGDLVEVSGPGGEISSDGGVLSTMNDGLQGPGNHTNEEKEGTSMAAPHIAGIVSLILSVDSALTPAQVLRILQNTATTFPSGSSCNTTDCGAGIVNAAVALKAADLGCDTGQYFTQYFNSISLTGTPVLSRCENAPIAYDWSEGGPGNGVNNNDFSVQWSGTFNFSQDTYTFQAETDDGIRVWIDGELVLDAWWDQWPTVYTIDREMSSGEHGVKVEFYENGGAATAHLHWWGHSTDTDDGRVITSRETLWGVVMPATDIDTYYFDAGVGQKATIQMTRRNLLGLDPFLILYSPNSNEVARDDDSGGGLNALINDFTITQTGRYRIEAKSYEGYSEGLHSLYLRLKTPGEPDRETYDADHGYTLPGTLACSEGDGPTGDQDVDDAHDFAGATYDYYWNTHGRDSYDDQGATLVSTANYGRSYMSAYWNGEQTVYGDHFPVKDVVAHEWTHAVTEHSAALEYRWQSGALNESFSDIFGAMVDRDDWLMGEDLPPHVLGGREAIRDLSDPPRFGQPGHTDDWVETCSDNEGVHTNSGIPNKAYYNIATAIGKDKAERIFYRALTVYLDTNSSLEDARAAALQSATDLYGDGSAEYNGVRDGFNAVGLDGVWEPEPNDCTCAATTALSDETVYSDHLSALEVATTLYRVRDLLLIGEAGEHYRTLYERHSGRVSHLLLQDAVLRAAGGEILKQVTPGLSHLVDGAGDEDIVTQETVDEVVAFLHQLAEEDRTSGDGELADTIEREMARIEWDRLVGMTYTEAWEYTQSRITVHFLYLPLVVK
jgi:serine protease